MAWKLKKWKSTEAEEQEAPEQGFEIADEGPQSIGAPPETPMPVFSEPEPSQVFTASQFVPEAPATEPLSDVIPLAPAEVAQDYQSEPADLDADFSHAQPVHDLDDSIDTTAAPIDFSASPVVPTADAPAHDYFAASASSDQSAFTQFQPEPANPNNGPSASHAAFDLDDTSQQAIAMSPVSSEPTAAAPASPRFTPEPPSPAPQTETDNLDAFAPYKPASAPPANDTAGTSSIPSQPLPTAADEGHIFTPVPGGTDNSPGAPPAANLPDYEDTLSFSPIASSRVIVKIGPFAATYEINKAEVTIGRPDAKTGTSPDIPLEWDDAVSRHHARILRKSDGDYIEDVGSSNGTLLNGQPIAVDTPILLKDGDVITIGERTQISYLR